MRKLIALIALVLSSSVADAHGCAVVRSQIVVQSAPVIAVQSYAVAPVVQTFAVQQVVQPVCVQSFAVQSFAVHQPVFAFSAFNSFAFQRNVFQRQQVIQRSSVSIRERSVIRSNVRIR